MLALVDDVGLVDDVRETVLRDSLANAQGASLGPAITWATKVLASPTPSTARETWLRQAQVGLVARRISDSSAKLPIDPVLLAFLRTAFTNPNGLISVPTRNDLIAVIHRTWLSNQPAELRSIATDALLGGSGTLTGIDVWQLLDEDSAVRLRQSVATWSGSPTEFPWIAVDALVDRADLATLPLLEAMLTRLQLAEESGASTELSRQARRGVERRIKVLRVMIDPVRARSTLAQPFPMLRDELDDYLWLLRYASRSPALRDDAVRGTEQQLVRLQSEMAIAQWPNGAILLMYGSNIVAAAKELALLSEESQKQWAAVFDLEKWKIERMRELNNRRRPGEKSSPWPAR